MKMNLKKLLDETDNGILDEIIGRSEKKMVEPFKKKETVIAIAKPEDGEEVDMEEKPEMDMEGEGEEMASEIPHEDMEKLIELYKSLKG